MKIAICLYGYLRQFELVYPNIIKNLKLEDKDFDLFIHTSQNNHLKKVRPGPVKWIEMKNQNKEYFFEKYKNLKSIKFNEDDDEYYNITEKVHKNKIEQAKKFIKDNQDFINENGRRKCVIRLKKYANMNINKNMFNKHFRGQPWIFRQNDQFIRLYLCNQLMNRYSKENNVNYDLVITLRPDIFITKEYDLFQHEKEFEEGKLLYKRGVDFFYVSNQNTLNKLALLLLDVSGKFEKNNLLNDAFFAPESQSNLLISKNMEFIFTKKIRAAYLHKNPLKDYFYENFDEKCQELYNFKLFNISQPLLRIM